MSKHQHPEPETLRPAGSVKEAPHIRWRFWILTTALAICLIGGFSPTTSPEARTAGFTIAGSIVTALVKPLESMEP